MSINRWRCHLHGTSHQAGLEQCLLSRVSDQADQCHTGEGKSTCAVWSQQISIQPDKSTAVLHVLGADPRQKQLVHSPAGRWLTLECHPLLPSLGTTGPITFELYLDLTLPLWFPPSFFPDSSAYCRTMMAILNAKEKKRTELFQVLMTDLQTNQPCGWNPC